MKQDKLTNLFNFRPKSKVKAGDGLDKGKYSFYTSSENQSKYLDEFQHEPGCLVFGTGGKASVHFTTSRFATSTDCIIIRPKSKARIDAGYVYQFFKGNMQVLESGFKGAGLKHISKAYLSEIQIPHPEEIDDQKRIAYLLGKVEGLIARRKQHLEQLDDLLKSFFLDMFSPQSPGYAAWPLVDIKDLAEKHKGAMRTGPFGSNLLHSEFTTEGDVAVLGIDNAVQNRFRWGERRFISNEKYTELQSYRIYPGDVVITIMGTIGRSAVIPDDIPVAINTKHLAAITLNRKVANPVFFSYSIHSNPYILDQFRSKHRGAIMSGLNLGLIKETKLKRPPIELQNRFAVIHAKIDEVKSRYHKILNDLETLYGALSQKAFAGDLDLSRIPWPKGNENKLDLARISVHEDRHFRSSRKALKTLNNFNRKHSAVLRALQNSAAVTSLDTPALKAAREMAEQASLWRTPLDELKNMASVARVMGVMASPSATDQLTREMSSIQETANIAKQIADTLPRINLGWLKEQQAMIDASKAPFSQMREAMAALKLPEDLTCSLREPEKATQHFHTTLPNNAELRHRASSSLISWARRNEEDEPRYIFTRHDILETLSGPEPLPLDRMMEKLSNLERITLDGYERIKNLIFELLNDGEIKQCYNEQGNVIQLMAPE